MNKEVATPQPQQPLTKDEAMRLLEEFKGFAAGMDDEIDEKISNLSQYIKRLPTLEPGDTVYTFEDLETTAPVGIYKRVTDPGKTPVRLAVLWDELRGGRVILFVREPNELKPVVVTDDSWREQSFTKVKGEFLKLTIGTGSTSSQNPD